MTNPQARYSIQMSCFPSSLKNLLLFWGWFEATMLFPRHRPKESSQVEFFLLNVYENVSVPSILHTHPRRQEFEHSGAFPSRLVAAVCHNDSIDYEFCSFSWETGQGISTCVTPRHNSQQNLWVRQGLRYFSWIIAWTEEFLRWFCRFSWTEMFDGARDFCSNDFQSQGQGGKGFKITWKFEKKIISTNGKLWKKKL